MHLIPAGDLKDVFGLKSKVKVITEVKVMLKNENCGKFDKTYRKLKITISKFSYKFHKIFIQTIDKSYCRFSCSLLFQLGILLQRVQVRISSISKPLAVFALHV